MTSKAEPGDTVADLPKSKTFLRQLDAWRLAQDDPPPREVALWILACGAQAEAG